MYLLLKDTIKIFLIIGLIALGIILFAKGFNINSWSNIYTEQDYYRDNPNATKSYDEVIKEEEHINNLKEEIKKRQNNQ